MPFYKGVPGGFAGDTCARGPIREAILLCIQACGRVSRCPGPVHALRRWCDGAMAAPPFHHRQEVKCDKCVNDVTDVKKVSWATVHGGNAHKACAKPDEP